MSIPISAIVMVLGLTCREVFIPSIPPRASAQLDLLSTAIGGSATNLTLEIANGSELDAGDLQVATADLNVTGVSKATVRVTGALTGSASDGATVSYISETVTPAMDVSRLSNIEQLPFTAWTAPVVTAAPTGTPVA